MVNLMVGVGSVNAILQGPNPSSSSGNYEVCATSAPQFNPGETRNIKCGKAGKWLIVQLMSTRTALTLCEVRVFGTSESNNIPLHDCKNAC